MKIRAFFSGVPSSSQRLADHSPGTNKSAGSRFSVPRQPSLALENKPRYLPEIFQRLFKGCSFITKPSSPDHSMASPYAMRRSIKSSGATQSEMSAPDHDSVHGTSCDIAGASNARNLPHSASSSGTTIFHPGNHIGHDRPASAENSCATLIRHSVSDQGSGRSSLGTTIRHSNRRYSCSRDSGISRVDDDGGSNLRSFQDLDGNSAPSGVGRGDYDGDDEFSLMRMSSMSRSR